MTIMEDRALMNGKGLAAGYGGNALSGDLSSLGGPLDPELLDPVTESAGVDVQPPGGPALALDSPVALLED